MVDQWVHLWDQPTVGQMAALWADQKACTSVEMTAASMVGLMGHKMGCQMARMMVVHWEVMTADWSAYQMVQYSVG